jgi:CDP-glucose 4,6-dehydratase
MTRIDAHFWRGRRVLVTGHTGFKGSWLVLWLARLGARVTGVALPPPTNPSLYESASLDRACDSRTCDVRDAAALRTIVAETSPEIVFHLAAQSLVRASYRDPLGTFSTNMLGTANLLDAIRGVRSIRSAVIVTTDKVYREGAGDTPTAHCETSPLGGHDPYSASKAASEIVVESYRQAFLANAGVAVSSARAGNVIGGGDWSDDRLIPDAMRAWLAGDVLNVRRPDAVRPWQHVLEPLAGYLTLAHRTFDAPSLAGAYNFGPPASVVATVRDVVSLAHSLVGQGSLLYAEAPDGPHESSWLALDASKAESALGVSPRWDIREAIDRTVHWYCRYSSRTSAAKLCHADIDAFNSGSPRGFR